MLQRESAAGDPEGVSYVLVGLAADADPGLAKADLEAMAGGAFKPITAVELSAMSQLYWLLESGTGAGFLFSTGLGLLVGVAIASQSLRAAMLASLREYATLRALGIPLAALRHVVLEQSFWIGAAGLATTLVLTSAVWAAATAGDVAIAVTWWAVLSTSALTLGVSLVSGLLSLGPLLRTEPADLLR
jgi:putative ABC transport system permease protein